MKTKFLLFIFTIVCYQIQAQSSAVQQREIEQRIRRNWVKYRIEMKDGSQVLDERITKNAASMLIFKKGNVGVLISGKNAQQTQYSILDSILVLSRTGSYLIEKLTEYELIFHTISENIPDNEIIRYHYVATTESSEQFFFANLLSLTSEFKPMATRLIILMNIFFLILNFHWVAQPQSSMIFMTFMKHRTI